MKKSVLSIFALFMILISIGCGANEGILRSGKETPTPAVVYGQISPFVKDLAAMRTAGFTFIYALRRKDGAPLDAEDRALIKVHTDIANRRVVSDDGKAIVVGSNFAIPADKMLAVNSIFAVEDYSSE